MGSTESIIRMIVLFVVLLGDFTASQDLQYLQDYINRKEAQVKEMAAEIVRLDGARCDLVTSCSPSNCSRHACTAIDGFDDHNKYNFKCKDQDTPNGYCNVSGHDCNGRNVNYAMSYVRMAPNIRVPNMTYPMCSTICMSRDFTTTLKNLSSADTDFEEYLFGSIDGVFRYFPGEEKPKDKCFTYDPRRRGWYNGAIFVQTNLIILIDNSYGAGRSQTESISLSTTMEASKQIAQQLIYALSFNDILDVLTFNETNATTLTPNPVNVEGDNGSGQLTDDRKILPELIKNITSTQGYSPSPSSGFVQAISTSLSSTRYAHDSHLPVILVLTDGQFAENLTLAERQNITGMLNDHSAKLFIYSFIEAPNLRALANEFGGYYEYLFSYFEDPLYQINSFYNFMALARNESDDNPYWTKPYEDFEGRGNITTVSYRALSPKGYLVGVTGIDIILKSVLVDLPNLLKDKSGTRPNNPSPLINPAGIHATNHPCGHCTGSVAVCPESSSKRFEELGCCDNCFNKMSAGKIITATVVPAVGLLVLVISVAWWLKKRREETNNPLPNNDDLWPYN